MKSLLASVLGAAVGLGFIVVAGGLAARALATQTTQIGAGGGVPEPFWVALPAASGPASGVAYELWSFSQLPMAAGQDYRLGDRHWDAGVGAVASFRVLEDQGHRQLVQTHGGDAEIVWSKYWAYRNRIEPISRTVVQPSRGAIALFVATLPGFLIGRGVSRCLIRRRRGAPDPA